MPPTQPCFLERTMCAWLHGDVPRWGIMWGLALLVYGSLKVLTWTLRRTAAAPAWKQLAYVVAWPGMDVDSFLNASPAATPATSEWLLAAFKTVLGILLLVVACPAVAQLGPVATGWMGMLGIVFTLHFGLFHLLSCGWRSLEIDARPIMNWPIAAQSLADFWGKRWNLAFRDLTNRLVFHPLVKPLGPSAALLAGFVGSGLVHDLVISIPAGGGYGRPTLYFTLQGLATLVQRGHRGAGLRFRTGVCGQLLTIAILVLPCPLLFHKWFVQDVIVPFIQAMGFVR